jgi:hypothetical protein
MDDMTPSVLLFLIFSPAESISYNVHPHPSLYEGGTIITSPLHQRKDKEVIDLTIRG